MATIIASCNQKGGVGKTTTLYHLARAAVVAGQRVLIIDADPQGNLSRLLSAHELRPDQLSIADVLMSRISQRPGAADVTPISETLVPGLWDGLDIAPAVGDTLSYARDQLVIAGAGREHKLSEALAEVRDDYDLVLIDCPPSLDQLTLNALTAADRALIVTEPRLLSLDGMSQLMQTITNVQRYLNRDLVIGGVLVNRVERGQVAAHHWMLKLRQVSAQDGWNLLDPGVPKRTMIANATETGEALDQSRAEGAGLASLYSRHLTTLMGDPA